jgi:hypothetical protein
MDSLANHRRASGGYDRRAFLAAIGGGLSLAIGGAKADGPASQIVRDPTLNPSSSVTTGAARGVQVFKIIKPPEFTRWPPHLPSTRYYYLDEHTKYQGATEDVWLYEIETKLRNLQYPVVYYFSLPDGGTAMVTPFERIDIYGAPIMADRFNWMPTRSSYPFGSRIIPRDLRTIVHLLTPNRLPTGSMPKSFDKHRTALEKGVTFIGKDMQFARVSPKHRLTSFIYEYYSDDLDEPHAVESKVRGELQLRATGIIK